MNLFNTFVTQLLEVANEKGYELTLEAVNGKRQGVVYTHYTFTDKKNRKYYLTATKEDYGPAAAEQYVYRLNVAKSKGDVNYLVKATYPADHYSIAGNKKARGKVVGLIRTWFTSSSNNAITQDMRQAAVWLTNTLKEVAQ